MTSASARAPSLMMLVTISCLQPMALNILAPATPALARTFGTSYGMIQLTLTVYLVAVAVVQLLVGPLSDRIGRRPCIIAATGLFVLGSIMGAQADDTALLLTARGLEGAGAGTTFALARAVIRDIAGKNAAASMIGAVTMVMVVVPMLAPLLGGLIDHHLGWRAIFLALSAAGCVVMIAAVFRLPETASPHDAALHSGNLFKALPILTRNARFLTYAGVLTMSTSAFFSFIAAAPYLVIEVMKGGPDTYGYWFMLVAASYMLGNFLTSRFAGRLGVDRMIWTGSLVSLCGLTIALVLSLLPDWSPARLFIPLALNALGNGLTIPSATAAALSIRPDHAGAAAGTTGAIQLGTGALAAFSLGWLVTIWPYALTLAMWAMAICGLLLLKRNGSGAPADER